MTPMKGCLSITDRDVKKKKRRKKKSQAPIYI